MADEIVLKIEGTVYGGWEAVSVRQVLAALASTFRLTITERWPGQLSRQSVRIGARCEVWIGQERLITGWIEERNRKRDAKTHTITVSGRDITCDLIDCSIASTPTTWKGQKLERIAADLIKPFGLKLKVQTSTGTAFKIFAAEPGEEVFAAITRACRMRGVIVGTDNAGDVLLFTPSLRLVKGSLEEGRNIQDIDVKDDAKDLFSVYVAKGQAQGGDDNTPDDAAAPSGSAKDIGVTRYRPTVIIADEQGTPASLKTRARWEATTRSAKSQNITIEVRGWRDDEGKLWETGTLIPVHAPSDEVDMTLMISEVEFVVDGSKGKYSRLSLVRKEAFTIEPLDEEDPGPQTSKSKGSGDLMSGLQPGTIIEKGFAAK
jgi:prophage tail gpP-like protein